MEIIDIINKILKISCINIFTYIIFIKSINYKEKKYIKLSIMCIISILESIVCIELYQYVKVIIGVLIIGCIHSLIIAIITKHKYQYTLIITFISLSITYLIYIISIVITGAILSIINLKLPRENMLIVGIVCIIEYLIIYKLFKIKRLKNGFQFLQNEKKINNIGFFGIAICGITIVIYSIMGDLDKYKFTTYFFIGIVIEAICLSIWLSKKLTAYYKQKIKENTILELENEIKEKDEQINKITEENREISTINHKYSNRIKALEKVSTKILSKPEILETMKTEFGEDFSDIQKKIQELSEEYSNEINKSIKHKNNLAKTGIFGIDNLLQYMNEEAEKNGISFNLKINGNINYMVENVIEQNRLETLLGDHIKDAIIAINNSNNTYKSILTLIGIVDNCYEVCIYDTGIEFEIETLLKLGKEQITTHKDTGRKRYRLYNYI